MRKAPKVYIIILNYNTWPETVECLESVLRIDYPNYQVVVIDNCSTNHSFEYIQRWAEGEALSHSIRPNNALKHLCDPPLKKPTPYLCYTRKEAELGGNTDLESAIMQTNMGPPVITTRYPLIIVQAEKNFGFAGGNNIGLRYACAKDDFEYVWILNNDTLVEADALRNLIESAEDDKQQDRSVGIRGVKLLYYDQPDVIQGVGGKYHKWNALGTHIGNNEKDYGQYDSRNLPMDYVMGASMLVSKEFLDDVGLMCEDYFLYMEEMDWVERGRKKGWEIAYCYKSKVYHKEAGSIGSNPEHGTISELGYYCGYRNRILFTKRFYPKYVTCVYLSLLGVMIYRATKRQFNIAKLILQVIIDSLRNRTRDPSWVQRRFTQKHGGRGSLK